MNIKRGKVKPSEAWRNHCIETAINNKCPNGKCGGTCMLRWMDANTVLKSKVKK